MNNLFKKGFASLVLASAMTSSIFAGNAAFISVKVEYVNTFKTDSKDGNVTAFKMHIKEGNLVATFNKDANHANSATIKLAVNERVAGERIESGDILFKKATASNTNLIPNQTDAKVGKLNFAINQTDEANLLIISAANKQDLVNAMPLNVIVNRIGKKMHLAVTIDKIGLKEKSTTHFFTKNVVWEKENQLLGNSSFEKQDPQVNLYSDATESTTDGNMTNANLLNNDGKGSEAGKGVMSKSNLLTAVNNIIPNVATTNTNQRKIVFEPLAFGFIKTTAGEENSKTTLTPYDNLAFDFSRARVGGEKDKSIHEPYKIVSVFSRVTNDNMIKTIEPYNVSVLGGAANKIKTYVDKKKTLYVYDNAKGRTHEKYISLNPASFQAKAKYSKIVSDGMTNSKQNMQNLFSFNSDGFLNVNNLGNNIETHATNVVAKGLSNKSGTFNTEKAYMIGQNGANISTVKKHFDSMAA